jgi:hypothetical protein
MQTVIRLHFDHVSGKNSISIHHLASLALAFLSSIRAFM